MTIRKYDKRMSIWDNFLYGLLYPTICWLKGHDWFCARVVPTDPQEYFWMCKRCADMSAEDEFEPCGMCENGCSN